MLADALGAWRSRRGGHGREWSGRGSAQLLIWPAGHTFGDLGWPRLNQRVALYAEQLFEKGPREMIKAFDLPDGARVDVRFEFPTLA